MIQKLAQIASRVEEINGLDLALGLSSLIFLLSIKFLKEKLQKEMSKTIGFKIIWIICLLRNAIVLGLSSTIIRNVLHQF